MLSDAQIERYSRQIIVAEIGAAGQERLLSTACAVLGRSALAATAARYLAGAGVGRVAVQDDALASELRALNPEIAVALAPDGGGAPIVVAADCARATLLALADTPPAVLVAAGTTPSGGWLHVATAGSGCAACAASAAPARADDRATAAIAASALGALAATEALTRALGRPGTTAGGILVYDAAAATLVLHPLARPPACPACAASAAP